MAEQPPTNLYGRNLPGHPGARVPPPEAPVREPSWCGRPRAADAGRRSPAGRDAGRRGAPRQRRLDFRTDQFGSTTCSRLVRSHLMGYRPTRRPDRSDYGLLPRPHGGGGQEGATRGYLLTSGTALAWRGWCRGVRRDALSSGCPPVWCGSHLVCGLAGHRGEAWLKRGLPCSK